MVAANDKVAVGFLLSSGEAGDAPKGRELLESLGHTEGTIALLMDRAYEGDETRALAVSLGYSRKAIGSILGTMTRNSTRNAMRLNAFSCGTSAFAGFVPATTNLISCSWVFLSLL